MYRHNFLTNLREVNSESVREMEREREREREIGEVEIKIIFNYDRSKECVCF